MMQDKPFNSEEIASLIKARRSVKPVLFTGEKIADEEVLELLDLANWAPNHGMNEPWRFVVMSNESLSSFATWQSELYRLNKTGEAFSEAKFKKLANGPLNCSHLIAIIFERKEKTNIPEWEDIAAIGGAMQNFHLGAVAKGYAGFWSSGFPTLEKEINDYLKLSERQRCLGFFYLGVPKDIPSAPPKGPIKEKIRWIK